MSEKPVKPSDLPVVSVQLLGGIRKIIEETRGTVAAKVNAWLTMLLPLKLCVFSSKNNQGIDQRKSCGRPNILCWTFDSRTSVTNLICAGLYWHIGMRINQEILNRKSAK